VIAALFTHRRQNDTHAAVELLMEIARRRRITMRLTPDEARKHQIETAPFVEITDDPGVTVDLVIVLGGDGTILTALRRYAGTGVPVFAVNYGEVGFLATIDPDTLADDFERAFSGEFETIQLPTISVGRPEGMWSALNDISVHRRPACASPTSPTRSRARRSAACVATGSSSPLHRGRRATTSPTAARCWPGAWRGTSCPSSRRTR
jgi:NAD+ kinase